MTQVEKFHLECGLSDVLRAVRDAHGIRKMTDEMWAEFKIRLAAELEKLDPHQVTGGYRWQPPT